MIVVPDEFRPIERHRYPIDNSPCFEEWFLQNFHGQINGREYLGVMWTGYYKNNSYGKDTVAIERLQRWIDQLPMDKKYFTIVQYDDSILNDLSHLDCKVFSMSGKPVSSIPIPLVCQPHKFEFPGIEKDILCSFVGRVTDPVRKTIVEWGMGRKDCYITSAHHPPELYCKILARSKFVLSPRGYGTSSFRTGEALQYGAIPFILTTIGCNIFEHLLPIGIMTYAKLEYSDLDNIEEHFRKSAVAKGEAMWMYRTYYTFQGLQAYIIQKLMDGDTLHS